MQKKTCSTIKRFFFFKYVLYYTVLSKYLKINVKVTVLEEKKVEIISISSLVQLREIYDILYVPRPCARVDEAKIVLKAQCNTKELP